MIIRIVTMKFKKTYTKEFEELFDRVKESIRAQEGCQHLELLRDVNLADVYMTYSIWNSTSDLNRYRESALFAETWKATKSLFAEKAQAHSLEKIKILT